MLRRQCTGEYKVMVINNAIRGLYRIRAGGRRPHTRVWIGITLDELDRMDAPKETWRYNVYPFTGFEFDYTGQCKRLSWAIPSSRADLVNWFIQNGFPIPTKSACVFCPYQSDWEWGRMKREEPEEFADAVRVDEAIRNLTDKGVLQPCFLHRSCIPLKDVQFDHSDLWATECSGNCHL